MAKSTINDWMGKLEDLFDKLPELPKGGKEAIVKITPWIALIFGILGLLAGLAGLGVLTAFSPFLFLSGGLGGAAGSVVSAILGIVASALLLAGFPGTKARKMHGWKMIFYSQAVDILAAVLAFSITGVLVGLIGIYLLFQIKSYYK